VRQVFLKDGEVIVDDVPAPVVQDQCVLVRVRASCVSPGTELASLEASGKSLIQRSLEQPQRVRQVIDRALSSGVRATIREVRRKVSAAHQIGYSAAGVVLELGRGVEGLLPGMAVACAGAQFAHHAEVICVPKNLVVPVPPALPFRHASTVALGAIALQGIRRASPTIGETFVVIGLGAVGQLTAQALRANGCRVIGSDLSANRVALAERLGMATHIDPAANDPVEQVLLNTDGLGADGVIVAAHAANDEVISTAFRMCRRKGRVVLVGHVGLNVRRQDIYEKELDFLISTSYGAGRYDPEYEERGVDYPFAYVRWTEQRNMRAYLELLRDSAMDVGPLVEAAYPIDRAADAYRELQHGQQKPLLVVLDYPDPGDAPSTHVRLEHTPRRGIQSESPVRVALVGAGSFAKGTYVPILSELSDLCQVRAVVSRTGANAVAVARQLGADHALTDYAALLADETIDAVILTTPHDVHASMAMLALRARKHVLVEKPLCMTWKEYHDIQDLLSELGSDAPVLQTGFNRRFAPDIAAMASIVGRRTNPMIIDYRMNAGRLPPDHWFFSSSGGGRNRGEACHIYDLFCYLTGASVESVAVTHIVPRTHHCRHDDNFSATFAFAEGSIATLTYTALGSSDHPKETMEVFVDGAVLTLNDYRGWAAKGVRAKGDSRRVADKGHRSAVRAFFQSIRHGTEPPIPVWEQLHATEMTLWVEDRLQPQADGLQAEVE